MSRKPLFTITNASTLTKENREAALRVVAEWCADAAVNQEKKLPATRKRKVAKTA